MNCGAPRRLRVLLSAFAISPNQGSEAGVGWNVAIRLAKYHDVTVLCGDLSAGRRTEFELQSYFETRGPVEGLNVCYVPPSRFARAINWLHGRPGMWYLYYTAYRNWQKDAYARAAILHSQAPFDLTHQLTFASFREPGYIWRLPVPFVWGPIGGASSPPLAMASIGGGKLVVRLLVNTFQRKFASRSAVAARKATTTWIATLDDQRVIEKWGGRAEYQCEVGAPEISPAPKVRKIDDPLRLVWSGLHIPRKALPLALKALARLTRKDNVYLDILGSGPETAKCKALARQLNIGDMLRWHSRLPQSVALKVMADGHALLLSSISEGTPMVLVEALALGMPVICHDACGMKTAVTERCGIKVPLVDAETSISGFCNAIERLLEATLYNQLAVGALLQAHELTWDRKVEKMCEAYGEAIQE